MIDPARRERFRTLAEDWRLTHALTSRPSAEEIHKLGLDLSTHCLRTGCRAELADAAAAYRSLDDYVRALLDT